ncbi:Mitochondrial import receptor subunit TOM5 [Hirschfeldia incana]|nr:Mitochondrial import receptor subunit TOM5 [Hirschfeldia incana]
MDQLKALWHSEVHNEQKWAANMVKSLALSFDSESSIGVVSLKLVRALGVFAGGIFLMRNCGDLMAI